jgi:succinate dehydrogenase / fumarate reductase membrane anchor subunit
MIRNALQWYLQRITGALLLILLAAHFWVEHFASAPLRRGELTYEIVAARLSNPVWQAIDIAFLLVALFHGLSGLRNIVLDYSRIGVRAGRAITAILILAGVVWAYWGIEAFQRL